MAELAPRLAFEGLLQPIGTGQGVTVCEPAGLGIATILAGPAAAALGARMQETFAITLPAAPTRTAAPSVTLLGTSRGTWLAIGDAGLAPALATGLAGVAHVADQSGAYGILDLTGPAAAAVLAKGLPIDLHPAVFAGDAVAVSQINHIGVVVWRVTDGFRLATPRSSAGSFWHWLSASAAEYGLAVG